jgi:hypothetical protein
MKRNDWSPDGSPAINKNEQNPTLHNGSRAPMATSADPSAALGFCEAFG